MRTPSAALAEAPQFVQFIWENANANGIMKTVE